MVFMKLNIWLAYVSFPITTATYFEKALRKEHNVITMGPKITDEIIRIWNLENLKREIKDLDYALHPEADMKELTQDLSKEDFPDLYLWVESVPGYNPHNLSALPSTKACYLIDTHLHMEEHIERAKDFDYVFLAQREYVPDFHKRGLKNTFWLPLGCDPETHGKKSLLKKYEIGFVGSVNPGSRREQLLRTLSNHFPVEYKRCFLDEMATFFSHSKIIFNNAARNDLNMRVFEGLCTGSFLLTDMAPGSGLTQLFHDGEALGYYEDSGIVAQADYYLKNGSVRETIGAKGRAMVLRGHTYDLRCNDMLDVVCGRRKDTPDIDELRDRSLDKRVSAVPAVPSAPQKEMSLEDIIAVEYEYTAKRSFIIPVLDLSSQTQYNFNTLLKDLEKIEGDVIVVFNSLEMADLFKDHPRITYYAIMSHNFGVARGWNIGLDMSNAPVSFIINSDLHIEESAILQLEEALLTLPDAAIVGPEGGYVDIVQAEDIQRFTKGTFDKPKYVDNVSGFFFAVKTDLFHGGILNFENKFTPCYFEEWDLGIQIKVNKLKAYIVPVTGYEHEFNTAARTGTLQYMRSEKTVLEISGTNQKLFWKKWLKDVKTNASNDHLRSLWFTHRRAEGESFLAQNNLSEAAKIFLEIDARDDEDIWVNYYLAVIARAIGSPSEVEKYARKALELDPTFTLASELLAM